MGPTYVQQRELREALHKQKVEFESRLLAVTTEFDHALQKLKDEFERDILEIKNMQDYHSSRLVAMHRRLPMRARLASPSKRPVQQRRTAEEEDEAPKPKRCQMTLIGARGTVAWDSDDEDKAASSAEVPPLLAAVVCLGATRLPHGGPHSFPVV